MSKFQKVLAVGNSHPTSTKGGGILRNLEAKPTVSWAGIATTAMTVKRHDLSP